MSEDPGAKDKGKSLLGGFSPLLAKLKERDESRKEFMARLRDGFFTWQPSPKRHTKKPILRGAKKRKRNKAAKLARRMNRKASKRPKGSR